MFPNTNMEINLQSRNISDDILTTIAKSLCIRDGGSTTAWHSVDGNVVHIWEYYIPDAQKVLSNEDVYVVEMHKYDPIAKREQYNLGVFHCYQKAVEAGQREEIVRQGKYVSVVVPMKMDNVFDVGDE